MDIKDKFKVLKSIVSNYQDGDLFVFLDIKDNFKLFFEIIAGNNIFEQIKLEYLGILNNLETANELKTDSQLYKTVVSILNSVESLINNDDHYESQDKVNQNIEEKKIGFYNENYF